MFFIYGAEGSTACDKAEFMLYSLGQEYRMFIYGRDYTLRQLHRLLPGASTVPHVYHGDKYIGGTQDLYNYLFMNGDENAIGSESSRFEKRFSFDSAKKTDEGDIRKD